MEQTATASIESVKKKPQGAERRQIALKKVDLETAKLLQQIKDKINKKPFGRKVRDAEILALAIKQLGPEHIKALQEGTLTERDRLQMVHDEYQKKHGKITLDEFIGRLIRGEIRPG